MPTPLPTLPISAAMNGRILQRAEVLEWEHQRALKVARRLRIAHPAADPATLMRQITDRKLDLGHLALGRVLAGDASKSAALAKVGVWGSRGRWRVARVLLSSPAGSAENLPNWYEHALARGEERAMLAAMPDHWIVQAHGEVTEVWEIAGGSPWVVEMYLEPADDGDVGTPLRGDFPREWVMVARNAAGRHMGGIHHGFRDRPEGGFDVEELNVAFPAILPGWMVARHGLHLASEFSNWLEFANGLRDP